MDVYKVINAAHGDLAKVGIAKNDTNRFDNYKFRGIDAVYNAVSPVLAKHGLLILQRVLSCQTSERQSAKGGVLFISVVDVEFDLVSAHDGSKHTIKTFGEGMDRGDKSINKALTAAYKYALLQAFCIPVDGSTDADPESHEVSQDDFYPDDKFQKNFTSWSQLISSGKQSADTLIKMAASKGQPLSPNQIGELKSIK